MGLDADLAHFKHHRKRSPHKVIASFCLGVEYGIDHARKIMSGTNQKPGNANHEYLLQFFAYAHLPSHLQEISQPFSELAESMVATLPANPERSAGLRKLLEAKDCMVRARLFK
jgi:hypothetical protein